MMATDEEYKRPADSHFKERNIMRVRVEATGPENYRLVVKNAETGEILPVWSHGGITINVPSNAQPGVITVNVKLIVSELDVIGVMKIDDERKGDAQSSD